MSTSTVSCPLCLQPAFSSLAALSMSLINVSSRSLDCPVCQDSLPGLDKFTIHIFGHALSHQIGQKSPQNGDDGVIKVIASTSGHSVLPIDIPIYFRQIDNTRNSDGCVLKAATFLNDRLLFTSRNEVDHDDDDNDTNNNKNNENETKSRDSVSCNTTQECGRYNLRLIESNIDSNINIVRDNDDDDTNTKLTSNNDNLNSIKHDNNVSFNNTNLNFSSHDEESNKTFKVTQNVYKSDVGIKNGCSSNSFVSNTNLELAHDNSYDLLKNLEPYIKYGGDNVSNKHGFVEERTRDLSMGDGELGYMSCGDVSVENTSNLVEISENSTSFSNVTAGRCMDVGETSEEIVDSNLFSNETSSNLKLKTSFPNVAALQCFDDVDGTSEKIVDSCVINRGLENNVCSSNSKLSKVDDTLGSFVVCNKNNDEHYEEVPLVFETESTGGLQNDLMGIRTKSTKKEVKCVRRKICKKSQDSSMTNQGVQTMEESFTKNNNPFGKFSTVGNSEDCCNVVSGIVSAANVNNSGGNEESTLCELCLFSFPDENILKMHKSLVHEGCEVAGGTEGKTFSCHLCSKSFHMRGSLMVHRRVAHPVLSGGPVSLRNIERIKDMKASTSFDDTAPQFSCKTCGKSFKKEQHLTQHERTHEVKQWECDICSKVFSTKYFLKKHKRLHTGEMPYTCATCGKSFTFQQSYHKHLLYHSDEKPHVCCQCGRAFKELSTLHNHQRIHTGEKPFACETCGKCFRQRVSYLVHRRIHTGVMPYKCTICNKSFRYKVSERTHRCSSNVASGQALDKVSAVVEKLKKLEEANANSEVNSSISISSSPVVLQAATNLKTAAGDDVTADQTSVDPLPYQLALDGSQLENLTGDKMATESSAEFWTGMSKPDETGHRGASSDENIFSGESSDFLSFVLTPTFSPSEQFQNLTLSPEGSGLRTPRGQGVAVGGGGQPIRNDCDDDHYQCGNFDTINEQSLKELFDNVDVL